VPYGWITGRVFDEHGKPVRGLRVELSGAEPKSQRGRTVYRKVRTTETDAQGRFRFELVAPGDYLLVLGNKQRGWMMEWIKVEPGKETIVEVGERAPLIAAEHPPARRPMTL
jgi:hypothetical protein